LGLGYLAWGLKGLNSMRIIHQVENSGMRKLLKLKEREHVRIKKLAQDIIAQRTEVEQFFLESLEQVTFFDLLEGLVFSFFFAISLLVLAPISRERCLESEV
jgi:hypothetical protein